MIEGDRLRAARELAGLSQQALASALDVSLKTVNNWENGRTKVPAGKAQLIEESLATELARLALHQAAESAPRLDEASDVELLSEIARRFARTDRQSRERRGESGGNTATTKAAVPTDLRERRAAAARDTGKLSKKQKAERAGVTDDEDFEPR